jgi:hypothetical protein
VLDNKVYSAKTGKKAERIYHDLEEKYPEEAPLITYIPKKGSLILWS